MAPRVLQPLFHKVWKTVWKKWKTLGIQWIGDSGRIGAGKSVLGDFVPDFRFCAVKNRRFLSTAAPASPSEPRPTWERGRAERRRDGGKAAIFPRRLTFWPPGATITPYQTTGCDGGRNCGKSTERGALAGSAPAERGITTRSRAMKVAPGPPVTAAIKRSVPPGAGKQGGTVR